MIFKFYLGTIISTILIVVYLIAFHCILFRDYTLNSFAHLLVFMRRINIFVESVSLF